MATTKTATKPSEAPAQKLDRQEHEYQLLLRDQDTVDARLAQLDKEQRAASEQDDTDTVLTLGQEREQLHGKLKDLRQLTEAKAIAVQTTRRQIAEANRAQHITLAVAHVKTMADIAPALEQSMFDTVDFIKRYIEQLRGAEQALRQLGDASGYTNPLGVSSVDVSAWVINQLINGAALPVTATFHERGAVVQVRGTAPVDLVGQAQSVVKVLS